MQLKQFHPLIRQWFEQRFGVPTAPQEPGWKHISEGTDTLIAAPTGSGKTFAAFLWWINELVVEALEGTLTDKTHVIYISPLRALGNDIQKNLSGPLAEITELAKKQGLDIPEIRVLVRSGDTPASERAKMIKQPPHILVTTPESFYILLTAERSREFLKDARAVIVDEIHATSGDKRGSHLALSLERLDLLAGSRCQRIGLSATQKPIEEIAQLLVGRKEDTGGGEIGCAIVDVGHQRDWDLQVWVPGQPLAHVASNELKEEIYNQIVSLVKEHKTTLVFVNTRRMVERVSHELSDRLGEGSVAAHHGSLSRKTRLKAEQGLKSGEVPVVVSTASLELGIDIGHVDLVCHIGAPRAVATLLQRVGRSGHWKGAIPKGVLFPLTRDELIQCAASVRAARAGVLDRIVIPQKPLDILSQQITAIAATGEITEDDLWQLIKRAYPYRDIERAEFDATLQMLADGVSSRNGRRGAHLHYDRINGLIRGRRGARLAAITSGGAIPDVADYAVIADPDESFVGSVNEDFAIESMAGDIFLLGNTSWRIRRVEAGKVRVVDAQGLPPTIPFWAGESPGRTPELSQAVSDLRSDTLEEAEPVAWLQRETGLSTGGAEQIVSYIGEGVSALGHLPTRKRVVAERFFDEAGGMQLVVHSPFGSPINRAWGLALRKRFCVNFDFELQAAATDDGIVLSLGEQHSFPLESIFGFVKSKTLQDTLVQAVLPLPMFTNRWRWNATRSLALLRFTGGRRVPMPIQRMRAEDMLAAVFPEQVACQENTVGPIIPPDHILVNATVYDCLHEAMNVVGATQLMSQIESGEIEFVSVETPAPSPFSYEVLNANPYAFLDDAPLEERRARAVALRRVDTSGSREAGALDLTAIEEVVAQTQPDIRNADELHDHLQTIFMLPVREAGDWDDFAEELIKTGRSTMVSWAGDDHETNAYLASEKVEVVRAAVSSAIFNPEVKLPEALHQEALSRDIAIKSIVQGWMQYAGPVTVQSLASRLGLPSDDVDMAMLGLEGSGQVLRGHFIGQSEELQWCDRKLLSRIHRLTVKSLREKIQPATAADFMKFLLRWQHVQPGSQLHGRDGLAQVIGQLQGFEAPAPSWETSVLPSRIANYDPAALEYLCLSGVVSWGRLAAGAETENGDAPRRRAAPTRSTPLAIVLREDLPSLLNPRPKDTSSLSSAAQDVALLLEEKGASFQSDIGQSLRLLPTQVEGALWELVSAGIVTGDSMAGLRQLLKGSQNSDRSQRRLRAVQRFRGQKRMLPSGRWSLWKTQTELAKPEQRDEFIASMLLRRYGVVFRDLTARERGLPPWRTLLNIYLRWEMQGEIRGGRFVTGFVGQQFALPEAVETLRSVRRTEDTEPVTIAAGDPLNLVGVILPGERISRLSGSSIVLLNGSLVDAGPAALLARRPAN